MKEEEPVEILLKWSPFNHVKPRPLLCWERGMTRTPISELPKFLGLLEFEKFLHSSRSVSKETNVPEVCGSDQQQPQEPLPATTIGESTSSDFLNKVVLTNSSNNDCAQLSLFLDEHVDSALSDSEMSSSSSILDDSDDQLLRVRKSFTPTMQSPRTSSNSIYEDAPLPQSLVLSNWVENSQPILHSSALDAQDSSSYKSVQSSLMLEPNEKFFLPFASTPSYFLRDKKFTSNSCPELRTVASIKTHENKYISHSTNDIASFDDSFFGIQPLSSNSRYSSINSENSSTDSRDNSSTGRYSCNSWSTSSLRSRSGSRNSSNDRISNSSSQLVWDMRRNFSQISASPPDQLGSDDCSGKTLEKKKLLGSVTVSEFYDSVLEPVSTSSDESSSRLSSEELPIPDFLEVALCQSDSCLKKPETLLFEINSADVQKTHLVELLQDVGAKVSRIDLLKQGKNSQEVEVQIVNCDGLYVVENLNGSSPFGPSVGAIRCKLL